MKTRILDDNYRRALYFMAVLSVFVSFSTSVLAVEDGLGTNVVKNLRVQDDGTLVIEGGGSITLNGDPVMDWNDLIDLINYDSHAITDTLSNKVWRLEASTNSLNTGISGEAAARIDADAGISNAYKAADTVVSNALDVKVGNEATARIDADAGISNAYIAADNVVSNGLNIKIGNETTARIEADAGISNAYKAADIVVSNALDAAKYDKVGGPISGDVNISGNVTMSNKVVYVANNQATVVAGVAIASGQAVEVIKAGGAVTMTIDPPVAAGSAGQMLTLIYDKADANSVTFTNTAGLALAGGVSFTMKANDIIQLISDGTKWVEVHRADNQ